MCVFCNYILLQSLQAVFLSQRVISAVLITIIGSPEVRAQTQKKKE